MPRPVNRQLSPEVSDGRYDLELEIGAVEGGATREELEVAWRIRRQELMERSRLPGTRPWGFWVFELGEELPRDTHYAEAVRLAELGELDPDERAAIAEKANEARMRLGTPREQHNGRPGEGGDADGRALGRDQGGRLMGQRTPLPPGQKAPGRPTRWHRGPRETV